MKLKLNPSWQVALASILDSPFYTALEARVIQAYQTNQIYPNQDQIYAALNACDFDQVKVVILGQDPYHGPNQANGLAFSVNRGKALPPSLRNIYQELQQDLGIPVIKHGDLSAWAQQGVLLLNTSLTVKEGQANSMKDVGWLEFTQAIIQLLGEKAEPLVFVLWGRQAQNYQKYLKKHHHIIKSAHPSPLSAYRGFIGSKPFSQINNYLVADGKDPIDWRLT